MPVENPDNLSIKGVVDHLGEDDQTPPNVQSDGATEGGSVSFNNLKDVPQSIIDLAGVGGNPPTVVLHASTHEDGGTDSFDGVLLDASITGNAATASEAVHAADATHSDTCDEAANTTLFENKSLATIESEIISVINTTPGTVTHSSLAELDYASSGHTGFSPDTHDHSGQTLDIDITGNAATATDANTLGGDSLSDIYTYVDNSSATSIDWSSITNVPPMADPMDSYSPTFGSLGSNAIVRTLDDATASDSVLYPSLGTGNYYLLGLSLSSYLSAGNYTQTSLSYAKPDLVVWLIYGNKYQTYYHTGTPGVDYHRVGTFCYGATGTTNYWPYQGVASTEVGIGSVIPNTTLSGSSPYGTFSLISSSVGSGASNRTLTVQFTRGGDGAQAFGGDYDLTITFRTILYDFASGAFI